MQIDKIIKREVISLVVSIVLILIIFIGVSFSSFFSVAEGETSQISFGDIELTLCEDTSCDPSFTNYGKTIGLGTDGPQATPIPIYPYETTADALSTVPYIFNLSNTGSLDVYVNLYLEEAESPELSGNYSSYTRTALLHANNIKIGLNECNGGSINTTNVSVYTYGNLDNNKILSNKKLNVDEDITYCMWVWLDENTPNDVQSTYFIADLRGTAEYKPSEWYYNALTLSKYPNYLTTKMLTSETPYADNVSSPNVTTATGINFGAISSSTNGQGLYYTTDENDTQDGSRVYYYRGNIDNNHVLFAGFCWRIIRTNEDGSVRMRYNGTPTNGACPQAGTNVSIGTSAYNATTSDNRYVGYMYGNSCTNYATCHRSQSGATTNSTIKTIVDNWYQTNIGANPAFNSKVDVSDFCNDRTVTSGTGVGTTVTYYAASNRRTNGTPTYKCSQANDIFKLKAGLLTFDEAMFAGSRNENNTSYYLRTGSPQWTMTPYNYTASETRPYMYYVASSGGVWADPSNNAYNVLPVISLKSDIQVSSGDGSSSNPWVIN